MSSTTWTPPVDPDPKAIRLSAIGDNRARDHETALAKFLWFHKNASLHSPRRPGDHRSFGLIYWWRLGERYPPAREAFIRTRDEAESAFLENPSNQNHFREFEQLNLFIGVDGRTADLFEKIARDDRAMAVDLYLTAERSLVAEGRFRVCGPFLDPGRRMKLAVDAYHSIRQHEESRSLPFQKLPKVARKLYIRSVGTGAIRLWRLNTAKMRRN